MSHFGVEFATTFSKTKHYINTPLPLCEYLCSVEITRSHEHVFMFHWFEGQMSGDWKSEVPVQTVAKRRSMSTATVKRAYSELENLGLMKRHKQGRCRYDPMRCATTITDGNYPSSHIEEKLLAAPDRCEAKLQGESVKESHTGLDITEFYSYADPEYTDVIHVYNGPSKPSYVALQTPEEEAMILAGIRRRDNIEETPKQKAPAPEPEKPQAED